MGKSELRIKTYTMGIDLNKQGRNKQRHFRAARTSNLYHGLLLKLYSFLARRTDSKFNQIVYKRLNQSNTNRYPISISRLVKLANTEEKRNKTMVIVGNVLNDERLIEVPKLNVCALKFTSAARNRIVAAGGRCVTFDQLAKEAPKGQNTWLVRGGRRREAKKHFGTPRDGAKPYVSGSHECKHKIKG